MGGVGGVSAEVEASGEGVGVGESSSGGIDSKGLGGPDEDMVRTTLVGEAGAQVGFLFNTVRMYACSLAIAVSV